MDEQENIMVSVMCLAYNHEKFIRRALDGFVMQKTNFRFEVIVHDDASSDLTAEIIREYEKKFPDIIRPIFQTVNQYSQKKRIIQEIVYPRTRGKYLAWCEGDDYWTDSEKLQSQVDAMEHNPGCSACIVKVERVTLDGIGKKKYFPLINRATGIFPKDDYLEYCLCPALRSFFPWQLSGLLIRKDVYSDYVKESPLFASLHRAGDLPVFLFAGIKGDIYYYDTVMSYYRTGNINSYTGSARKTDYAQNAHYSMKRAEAYHAFDEYTNGKYHKSAEKAIRIAEASACYWMNDLKTLKKKEMRPLFYDDLPLKSKIKLHLFYYFPWSQKIILFLRSLCGEIKFRIAQVK